MPIQYESILDEASAVRSSAGLFDVSHMGRVHVEGPAAGSFLNCILSIDVPRLRLGRGSYNVICDQQGGIIDDCIVYRRSEDRFLVIPNASNTAAVLEWFDRWVPGQEPVRIENITASYVMIALQGPLAVSILARLTSADLSAIRPFAAVEAQVLGIDTLIARTGYTGEDGFELILPSEHGADVWDALVGKGAVPCGLGARDVLRLEAGLLLHGNDIDTTTNPYEAGLDRFVVPDREGYVAGEALRQIRDQGVARRLVGFRMLERGIPRHGYTINNERRQIGIVTSGGHSRTLDRNIGMGYVPTGNSGVGTRFQVDIRGRPTEAEVTSLPFYSRKKVT